MERFKLAQGVISRSNLIQSLITGLVIGVIVGAPLGWLAHRFFEQQRLAGVLLCREENRNLPAAQLQSVCGSPF